MIGEKGTVKLHMGNEAVARGAVEAGAGLVIGYPGTPSSEVIPSLIPHADTLGIKVEWAVNEKVAFDIATGASYAGVRTLVTMKSAGLNVASDSIISVAYGDLNAGLVIYVADDPGLHAGMEEQDSRVFTAMSLLPMIDVCDPQDSKDAVVAAFEASEEYSVPIIVRSTSAVAHMKGTVTYGSIAQLKPRPAFTRDISRFTRASPAWCKEQHKRLNEKAEDLKPDFTDSKFNEWSNPEGAKNGIIASGITWVYLKELLNRYNIKDVATLRVGTLNPLPEEKLSTFLHTMDNILVLEELEPYIELRLKALAYENGSQTIILGKKEANLPRVGEYSQNLIEYAIEGFLGRELASDSNFDELQVRANAVAPRRPLPFCSGCPHRGTYTALKQALRALGYKDEEVIVTGDIGCTILGMHPPFNSCWTEVSMGASIGLAIGFKYAGVDKPVIATIGDSTFFHAGLPPSVNASWREANIVITVLDNHIAAMTGHQPSPSSGYHENMEPTDKIPVEDILKAMGIEHTQVVDPYNLSASKEAFTAAIEHKGPSAVILRRTCSLVAGRQGQLGAPSRVNPEKCRACLLCVRTLSCPSMTVDADGKMVIDESTCMGCGVCSQVCPFDAIIKGGGSR